MALLVCIPLEKGSERFLTSEITSLGVEVSLDTDLRQGGATSGEEAVEPSDALATRGATASSQSSGPATHTESSAADSMEALGGLGQAESGLDARLGKVGTAGEGSGPLRGISRAPLGGSGAMLRADQKARLAPESTACADLFPYQAEVTRGEVTATLDVDSEGRSKLVKLEKANPTARGFEAAASACAKRLRFEPARDSAGRTVASLAQVKLVFERESQMQTTPRLYQPRGHLLASRQN